MDICFCYNCGSSFDVADASFTRYDRDEPTVMICPVCGDDNIGDAYQCVECEEHFAEHEIAPGTDYCFSCEEKLSYE